jgi:hypothetical protein
MTQRTGRGGPTLPPTPPRREVVPSINPDAAGWEAEAPGNLMEGSLENDLGLRPEEPYQPDPSGFLPASQQTVDVAGRKAIMLTPADLAEMHYAQAGTASMVHDPGSLLDRKNLPSNLTEEEKQMRLAQIAQQREIERQRQLKEEAQKRAVGYLEDELMQGYQPNERPANQAPTIGPTVHAPNYFGSSSATSTETPPAAPPVLMPSTIADLGEGAKVLESLVAKAAEARSRGDIRLATELNGMIQQLLLASNLKRKQPQKERHPALANLLSNLGLEKIKPVEVPWMGTTWRFAARPEELDWWVAENMGDGGLKLNSAIVSASLVGMDGAPLYQVLNIPLSANYVITREATANDPGGESEVVIPSYTKLCPGCGNEVTLDSEKCVTCGALLDPFEVPVDLRLRYAAVAQQLFQEKLCLSSEQLGQLVALMRKQMKDRRLDQAEVYPLTRALLPPKQVEEGAAQSEKTPG